MISFWGQKGGTVGSDLTGGGKGKLGLTLVAHLGIVLHRFHFAGLRLPSRPSSWKLFSSSDHSDLITWHHLVLDTLRGIITDNNRTCNWAIDVAQRHFYYPFSVWKHVDPLPRAKLNLKPLESNNRERSIHQKRHLQQPYASGAAVNIPLHQFLVRHEAMQ